MADTSSWIRVILVKEGLEPEGVPVTYLREEDGSCVGLLELDPQQDFGCHKGDEIIYGVYQDEDGSKVLLCDCNHARRVTEEELADGKLLKSAIEAFVNKPGEVNFFEVLLAIRDSKVQVPMSAEGQPDVFANGGDNFLPVFTCKEEMGEYGDQIPCRSEESMLKVIELARECPKELLGIVINPFSQPFVLDHEIWNVIGELKSRLS